MAGEITVSLVPAPRPLDEKMRQVARGHRTQLGAFLLGFLPVQALPILIIIVPLVLLEASPITYTGIPGMGGPSRTFLMALSVFGVLFFPGLLISLVVLRHAPAFHAVLLAFLVMESLSVYLGIRRVLTLRAWRAAREQVLINGEVRPGTLLVAQNSPHGEVRQVQLENGLKLWCNPGPDLPVKVGETRNYVISYGLDEVVDTAEFGE